MRFTPKDELSLLIRDVLCPFCRTWVSVDGWSLMETLWMHEYECSAIEMAA